MTKDNSYRSPTTKDGTTSLPKYSPETLETTFQDFLESVGPGQCVYLATIPSGSLVDSKLVEGLMRKFMNQKNSLKKFADSCTYSVMTETVGPSQESGSRTMDDPEHYLELGLTPWEAFDRGWLTREEFIGHLRGTVLEYVARAPHKNGVEDYKKAMRCLEKLVSLL